MVRVNALLSRVGSISITLICFMLYLLHIFEIFLITKGSSGVLPFYGNTCKQVRWT